ncbi:MAG TPA: helix-turn-helix domain-containing protein [Acidimicrobiia bacterium]|nr:helix-turn-helix domain-containing protein [Acidimicrobiia bacterium]
MSTEANDHVEEDGGEPIVDRDLEVVASLAEPLRRALYDFVAASAAPVSRDAAAETLGVSRQVAAYHLDRLAEDGLLEFEFRRLSGRDGPGAGRPSKLYRRSDRVYDVSVPARRYELAARILLEAIGAGHADEAGLGEVARRTGRQLGEAGLEEALVQTGYEPADEGGETRFRNCPFHVLRDQDQETTCSLNLALVEGMIEGSESDVDATLAPEDGYCCVRLRPKS